MNLNKYVSTKKQLKNMDKVMPSILQKTKHTITIRCPHCNHIEEEVANDAFHNLYISNCPTTITCKECGGKYTYSNLI